jgi:hypothetical protein
LLILTLPPFIRMKISRSSSTTTAAIEATQIPLTRVRGGTVLGAPTGGAAGGSAPAPEPPAPGYGSPLDSGALLRSSYVGPVMAAIYPGEPAIMPVTTSARSRAGENPSEQRIDTGRARTTCRSDRPVV